MCSIYMLAKIPSRVHACGANTRRTGTVDCRDDSGEQDAHFIAFGVNISLVPSSYCGASVLIFAFSLKSVHLDRFRLHMIQIDIAQAFEMFNVHVPLPVVPNRVLTKFAFE
jgi:hypothetical protein